MLWACLSHYLSSVPISCALSFLFFVFLQKFFQCKSYHFSQDILLHIGDSYLKHKNICLFETQRLMLADIIRIKNNRSEHQNGYQTLINYTDMISSNSAFGSNFSYVNSLANAIVGFVETSSKDQLEMFYIKICSKPYRERCKLYQYVLFNIFQPLSTLKANSIKSKH